MLARLSKALYAGLAAREAALLEADPILDAAVGAVDLLALEVLGPQLRSSKSSIVL